MFCKQSWQRLDNNRHRSSGNAAFGGIINRTTSRHRRSKHAAFGGLLNWMTSRHRSSRHAAFGGLPNRMTFRHRRSTYTPAASLTLGLRSRTSLSRCFASNLGRGRKTTDTVLQGMHWTTDDFWTTFRRRRSKHAAFGGLLN